MPLANISTRAAIVLAGLASITCMSPAALASGVANGALSGDKAANVQAQSARQVEVILGRREEKLLNEIAKIRGTTIEAELAKIIERELIDE